MYDRDFEKRVQQKMEELKFSPSASVWNRVEKELTRNKQRRKPVFWLLSLLFLAASGGIYFYFHENKPNSVVATKNSIPSPYEKNKSGSSGQNQETIAKSSSIQTTKAIHDDKNVNAEEGLKKQNPKKHIAEPLFSKTNKDQDQISSHNQDKKQKTAGDINTVQSAGNNKSNQPGNTKAPAKSNTKELAASAAISSAYESEKNLANTNNNSETKPKDPALKKVDSTMVSSPTKSSSAKQKGVKQQKWNFGIAGGAGVSTVFQSIFKTTTVSSPTYLNNVSAPPPNGTAYSSSTIRPGFSFNIGFHVQKGISSRWLFTTGLFYHYYTTEVQTGTKVDSPITVMTNSTVSYASRYYYTRGSNSNYTDHYHFIQLPVTMQYEFARIHKFHLAWEAGLSLSQLIASDELHFDNSTGVYYKASDQLNKTQLNVNTAFLVSSNHNKLSLQFGPQVEYGLTNMLKSDAESNQHMFYAGLKILVVPNLK